MRQDVVLKTHEVVQDFYCRRVWGITASEMSMSKKFFVNKEVKKLTRLLFDETAFNKMKEIFV
jgi:hypothetical protein